LNAGTPSDDTPAGTALPVAASASEAHGAGAHTKAAPAASPPKGGEAAPRGWLESLLVYRQPRVLSMIFLGFSAGLPFYLVFQTLSAWLRQEGIERSTIGMLSWVGLAYTFKFIWAPIVDRAPIPFLTRWLGRRRSWMLMAQAGIALCILNMSWAQPSAGVLQIAVWALLLAFCAATQDIAIDAWRIESASVDLQGAMAAGYQIGYRVALICASAGAFTVADKFGWHASYATMAALVGVGVLTTLLVREPQASQRRSNIDSEERVIAWLRRNSHLSPRLRAAGAWFIGAVVCPLTDFFSRYGIALGLVIFAFMSTYRLTEYTMGPMANPFYIDHGYTLIQIARVVKVYGLATSLVGVLIAGVLIARFGLVRSLIIGSMLIMLSNLSFSLLASTTTPTLLGLGIANVIDNLAQAIHGTSLIAFLSSLTSPRYTATQYALFSSLYTMPGKLFFEGTSGFVVEAIDYPLFFVYTASLSLPALLLLWFLVRRGVLNERRAVAA
jgi:PAT family beta-lactamase induction signal transducer AmpG